MEKIIEELLTNAPSIGAIVFLVWIFIRYLEKKDLMMKEITDDCRTLQKHSLRAIEENTKMLGKIDGLLTVMNGSK